MSKPGYSTHSNAKKVIENFKKMTPLAEAQGIMLVNDSLAKIYQLIVPLTPLKTGDLRRGYRIVKARKLSSGRIVGALINNEKYFKYVNDGHKVRKRTVSKKGRYGLTRKTNGFVKGRFMLQKAQNLAHMTYIPRRFKQMAIVIAKKG
ncbi:HK97 gp10 family phage protein [Enterococcus sp. AZ192]|uniref:HK97 gp10 family phage protein n=1 Tax=unclassified Enterococcus TaxID=2608891 RepID=UPI003D29656D